MSLFHPFLLDSQGQRVGIFAKDRFTGDFVDGWKAALDATEMEQVQHMQYCRGIDAMAQFIAFCCRWMLVVHLHCCPLSKKMQRWSSSRWVYVASCRLYMYNA